ncbi:unnamed protein product [Clavelina lepadiformis]|uniref:Uncharacterized protein n=1 Tax=Clavelina lepadiformis TaxID=159417 RepID=A0ABP0EZK6_CLALP
MGSGASKSKSGNSTEKLQTREGKSLIKNLSGHTGGINCMDISSNLLLTGSDDRTARIWDLDNFECKVVLEGHGGYVSCCKLWSGNYALTGSFDKTIRKWNNKSGNCILKLEHHSGIVSKMLVFGDFLFTSSYDSTAVCWNLRSGEASRIFRGHTKSVLPIAYVKGSEHDPGGSTDLERNRDSLVTGSMDRTAKLWNITSATSLKTFRGHQGAVLCVEVDLESKMLFTGSTDHTIRKWSLATGAPLKVFKGHEGSVLRLQLRHRLLYSASVDTTARCWVAEFGDTTRKYVGHDHMISDMTYHHGIVFTGSGDNTVRAFDAKSGAQKRVMKGHRYVVNCLQPHDGILLSGSYDGVVKVWNIRDIIKDKEVGSTTTLSSSVRSSTTQHRRHSSDTQSEIDVTIKNELHLNGHKTKRANFVETTNETTRGHRRVRRPHGGKIAPSRGGKNVNNNSIYVGDFSFGSDKLDAVVEGEDYWAESSNQSSLVSLNEKKPINGRMTVTSQNSKVPESTGSKVLRSDFHPAVTKQISSDLLTKRPRTDTSLQHHSDVINDLALVDEEMRMIAMETSSNTSGYRTADNNSPTSPITSSCEQNAREKSSSKENRRERSITSQKSSKIPTAVKTSKHIRGIMTPKEKKQLEQEILDMV